jgi:hypothetical protein
MAKTKPTEAQEVPIDNQYPIPIYLNQKHVFSILAMMEGGFAQLQTIKETRTEQEGNDRKVSGQVGVSNAFSFLGIQFGGERGTHQTTGDVQEVQSEKVHTPDSLFARMRERLHQQGKVQTKNFSEAKPGQYIEFEATLRKNPLIDTFETIVVVAKTLRDMQEVTKPNQSKVGSGNKQSHTGKQDSSQGITNNQLKQMEGMLKAVKGDEPGGTVDLIGTLTGKERMESVLIADPNYADDPTFSDLVDGEYTILGKVVRVIPAESGEKINLLRKTGLGKVPEVVKLLAGAITAFSDVGVDLPDPVTEIEGPAIQVLPIAIFL